MADHLSQGVCPQSPSCRCARGHCEMRGRGELPIQKARARKAELIAQVRNGTPPLWEPKPGWSERFSDDVIWDAIHRVAKRDGSAMPMMVACELVENVIDGRL